MAFTWADRRRFMIIGGASLVALTLLAGLGIAIVYEAPSCMDLKQNQDEEGVDCGGSCALLCATQVQQLRPTLARALPTSFGRTDAVVYVENRNQDAEAKGAKYEIEVFDEAGVLLGAKTGTIDIPARATVPIFVPGVVQGVTAAPRAFVTFTDIPWRMARGETEPLVVGRTDLADGESPRITVTVENPSPHTTHDRVLVATVFNASGIAIAASQTIVPSVPGLGSSEAVFTWNAPFPEPAARVEVRAQPRLP